MEFKFTAKSGNVAFGRTIRGKGNKTVVDVRWTAETITPNDIKELEDFVKMYGGNFDRAQSFVEANEFKRQRLIRELLGDTSENN